MKDSSYHINDHMACGSNGLNDYIILFLARVCRGRERILKKYNRFKYVLETASNVDQRDILKELHSNIRLFADDTSLYIVVDFPDTKLGFRKTL